MSTRRVLLWMTAGLVAFAIGLPFRLFPLTHNVSSDAYEQGTMIVVSRLRAAVAQQVERESPGLPAAQKEQLIKERFDRTVREHSADLRKAFDLVGQQVLEHSGDTTHYLQEVDSYYFLGLTEEILEKGHFGTKYAGGKYFNDQMLAPLGYWQPQTWHPYIGAAVYKLASWFKPGIDVMFGVSFTNILLVPAVLAAFLFACRSLGCSLFPSSIAAIFFVLAPVYVKRSSFAWFKDDTYNIFFPLLALGLLFLMAEAAKRLRRDTGLTLLLAITLTLYAQFWAGWGFLWGVSIATLTAGTIFTFFRDRAHTKRLALLTGLAGLLPLLTLSLVFGFTAVWQLIFFAFGELNKFTAPGIRAWPNLFMVVGELKKTSFTLLFSQTGGPVMFMGGFLAFIWAGICLFKKFTDTTLKIFFLGAAFAITLYLAISAERFTILFLTPLSLFFAWGLEQLWSARIRLIQRLNLSESPLKPIVTAAAVIILLGTLFFPLQASCRDVRSYVTPIFNSAWDKALTKLRDHSPANSIVNAWWSPGHFIKAVAKRRVMFDGASINGEQGYWLTRVYLSQTEKEALGILRMVNTSSNSAAEFLQKRNIPLSTAVPLLLEADSLNRVDARRVYAGFLPPQDADTLLTLTHGTPPPSYVLVYQEIVEGNVLLGYLGKWNFKRVEDLNNRPELARTIPARGSKEYVDFVWKMVGGPYRQSPTLNAVAKKGTLVLFDQGVTLDTATMTVTVNSPQFGRGQAQSVFYAENGAVIEKPSPTPALAFSAVVFRDDDGAPHCVLMDRVLANSLLVRMYYLNGVGLHYFKPFSKERDITGRTRIYIYEVDWSGLP